MHEYYIVVPFKGTDLSKRQALYSRACQDVKKRLKGQPSKPVESYLMSEPETDGMSRLALMVAYLAEHDAAYFCAGWSKDKNCQLLIKGAQAYGKDCVFE